MKPLACLCAAGSLPAAFFLLMLSSAAAQEGGDNESPAAIPAESLPVPEPRPDEVEVSDEEQGQEPATEPASPEPPPETPLEPPETPEAAVTPEESVRAAAAVEDALACEEELTRRGVAFTVEESISDGDCGVLRPVSMTRTSNGTAIEPATEMLCRTALAFDVWVAEAVVPAAADILEEEHPAVIRHGSTYVCRDRAGGGTISEHARGSAIDVMALEWEGREPIPVERQAPGSDEARFLTAIRAAACGPFKTILGPGTDADHADHFHFDVAARRAPYCR